MSMPLTKVVVITGCDSGLGWAIAARAARQGLITVAGMYHGTDTPAARALKKVCAHPCDLDVTKPESVDKFRDFVRNLLKEDSDYELYAVVNNAGIMTVGDYEWQTPSMIENTINVNLLGSMRVVSAFLPDLRRIATETKLKPRIINVASHCGLQPLPGFAPYSASKAGLIALTRALRLEQRPFGLAAVTFVPGGFIKSSSILGHQEHQSKLMLEHLDEEQKKIYEKRIKAQTAHLQGAAQVSQNSSYDDLKSETIIETFMKALLDEKPKQLYKVESWRYMIYYTLMKLPLPEYIHHWIVKKFINFPK